MSLMPNIQKQALVVSKVTETRNGIIVGTSMQVAPANQIPFLTKPNPL
jgi:NAD-dependent SIR2 family protein deacetylase